MKNAFKKTVLVSSALLALGLGATSVSASAFDDAKAWVKEGVSIGKEGAKEGWGAVKDGVKSGWDATKEGASKVAEKVEDKADDGWDKTKDKAGDAAEWMGEKAQDGGSWLKEKAASLSGKPSETNQKRFEELVKAARAGSQKAQYRLAECYARGYGVPKNMDSATVWLKEAARAGYKPALRRLVSWYTKGTLDGNDPDRAELFRLACEQGFKRACE